jgi:diguanylate cyclase (GGDEF)-like protein
VTWLRLRIGDDLASDEFVVVLTPVHDASEMTPVLQRILEALSTPFALTRGLEVTIGASLGVAMFPIDGSDAKLLLSKADAAMYAAKRAGKGQIRFHVPG